MNEGLFQIILALIPVIGAILTGFIIPLIKEKIETEKLAKYEYWVTMAVNAAEKLFTDNEAKKEYVVKFLNDLLNKNKVVITEEQLNVLIEAAVNELKSEN